MPTFFEDDCYVVSQAMLGGWKIIDKGTGRRLQPSTDQKIKIGLVWKALRSRRYKQISPPGNLAEDEMFFRFAQSADHPNSRAATAFLEMSADELAEMFIQEANANYLRNGLKCKRN